MAQKQVKAISLEISRCSLSFLNIRSFHLPSHSFSAQMKQIKKNSILLNYFDKIYYFGLIFQSQQTTIDKRERINAFRKAHSTFYYLIIFLPPLFVYSMLLLLLLAVSVFAIMHFKCFKTFCHSKTFTSYIFVYFPFSSSSSYHTYKCFTSRAQKFFPKLYRDWPRPLN